MSQSQAQVAPSVSTPGPLVSVIINNYNYGRFLRQTIDSVLAQTYPHLELLVVDDGSTDDSASIIRSYGSRVKAIFKPNGGHGSCFNAGFAASRGELVLFLDADDYYQPEAIAEVVAAARSGAMLIQFRLRAVDARGRFLYEFPARLDEGDVVPLLVSQGRFTGMVTTANAFRREALRQVLPLPEQEYTQAADGYLLHMLPFLGKVAAIQKPLACYRLHGGNDSALCRGAALDVGQVRRRLRFTTREVELVRLQAARRGLKVPGALALRHLGHVQLRLASCKLEPEAHPFPGDAAWKLGGWGVRAAWRTTGLSLRRRVLLAGWFALVGLSPRPLARKLIARLLAPEAQSPWARKLLSWKRALPGSHAREVEAT